jgi:hypothetical protein
MAGPTVRDVASMPAVACGRTESAGVTLKERNMKKLVFGVATAFALATGIATAATMTGNGLGSSCATPGDWHFVNNQTNGAAPGTLTATIGGVVYAGITPSQVSANNQQFWIYDAPGTLTAASTNLPGRLVLSDLICDDDKKDPDPDPKP